MAAGIFGRDESLVRLRAKSCQSPKGASASCCRAGRFERAAIEYGGAASEPRLDRLVDTFRDLHGCLRSTVTRERAKTDEQGMHRDAYRAFIELAHEVAWVIAADLASQGEIAPKLNIEA